MCAKCKVFTKQSWASVVIAILICLVLFILTCYIILRFWGRIKRRVAAAVARAVQQGSTTTTGNVEMQDENKAMLKHMNTFVTLARTRVKILVGLVQVVSLLGPALRVAFTEPFTSIVAWTKLINVEFFAFLGPIPLGCIVGRFTFTRRFWFAVSAPFGMLGMMLLYVGMDLCLSKRTKTERLRKLVKRYDTYTDGASIRRGELKLLLLEEGYKATTHELDEIYRHCAVKELGEELGCLVHARTRPLLRRV